jgi:hypothetical protein
MGHSENSGKAPFTSLRNCRCLCGLDGPFPISEKIGTVLLFQRPGFMPGGKALFIFFLCNAVPFSAIMYYLRPWVIEMLRMICVVRFFPDH